MLTRKVKSGLMGLWLLGAVSCSSESSSDDAGVRDADMSVTGGQGGTAGASGQAGAGGTAAIGGGAGSGGTGGGPGGSAGMNDGGTGGVVFSFPAPPEYEWTSVPANIRFYGFWGTDDKNVYGVGDGGIMHFDGNQWRHESAMVASRILGVWGSGPDDIYAAVESNVVLRRKADGMWNKLVLSGFAGWRFNAVWGSGPNDVYLVGAGILHSKGDDTWVEEPDGTLSQLLSVGGYDAKHVYVGGPLGILLFSKGDGIWVRQSVPSDTTRIVAIHARSPTDVYALGSNELFHGLGDGRFSIIATKETGTPGFADMWTSGNGPLFAVNVQGGLYYLDVSNRRFVNLRKGSGGGVWGYQDRLLVYGDSDIEVGKR